MSMYETIFADGESGLPLLESLGFKNIKDVGRYRSAWIEKGDDGQPRIAVYTRNGGGNRDHWKDDEEDSENDCLCTGCIITRDLPKHPNYLFDKDDSFDCTYATVYFSIPEVLSEILDKQDCKWKEKVQDEVDMSNVWQKTIDSL